MQYVTTRSGTTYEVDAENLRLRRVSDRELVWTGVGEPPAESRSNRWREYKSITLVDRYKEGTRCMYVDYNDGTWSCSTEIVSVKNSDGDEAEFLVTGPAFLAGVNTKYSAVALDFVKVV
jgi:hypothetical protein